METAHHAKTETHLESSVKDVVVVFDGKNTCITDILRAIVTPKQVSADYLPPVVALGFIDGSQFREIVNIIDRNKTPAQ